MDEPLSFSGKVALVTGSSRGIGAGIIAAFGKHGARCVVNYVADDTGRNQKEAAEVAISLPEAMVVQCDVGDAAQAADMLQRVREKFGALDILVNNAGIL